MYVEAIFFYHIFYIYKWLKGYCLTPSLSSSPLLQVKVLPLFEDQMKFEPTVGNQKLEMENILVYYVDEEAPTFTMKHLSGGIIAVIVVVVLVVVAGLLVLVSAFIYLSYSA